MEKMKSRPSIYNDRRIALPNEGVLTFSFRGSAAEIGVHLLARPAPDADFFEGSSTTIDTYDHAQPQLKTDFYMAMHALLTNPDLYQNHSVPVNPKDIAGKGLTIETRPARRENITGNAEAESIHLCCTNDFSLYMRVVGQDLSFPSSSTNLIYQFPQDTASAKDCAERLYVVSSFAELLKTYGTKGYTP